MNADTMKAIVYDTYGSPDALEMKQVDKPVPGDGDVMVRVRAASLDPADWHFVRGVPYPVRLINGLRRPRRPAILGADLTFEQAAAMLLAGLTALQALRDTGEVQPGQRVLINGASGGVGTFAVQLARSFGADVTSVCSTRNVDLVRSLGSDEVIDYTRENSAERGHARGKIVITV